MGDMERERIYSERVPSRGVEFLKRKPRDRQRLNAVLPMQIFDDLLSDGRSKCQDDEKNYMNAES